MHNKTFHDKMLTLLPDSAIRLVSTGRVQFAIEKTGPAMAWTEWLDDKLSFRICFTDEAEHLTDDDLVFLWYHELAHITMGHFGSVEPCGPEVDGKPTVQPDWLIAADIGVNWMLQNDSKRGKHADRFIEQQGAIDSRSWLEELGLGQRTYPFFVLHDILHKKVEEESDADGAGSEGDAGGRGSGICGGIDQTADPSAIISAIAAAKAGGSADAGYRSSGIGSEAGRLGISLTDSELPAWLAAVERFARSIVEVELRDGRTHKRAQPTLRSAGIRVPSLRPTYKSVPSTLCLLVDTSGSMMGDLKYVSPVLAYLKQNGIKVRLIAGDTHVTFDELIDRIPEKLEGAGGTDIVPLFTRANDYEPKAVVCFTDGYVPAYPEDNGTPTLWVGVRSGEAPYGETVAA